MNTLDQIADEAFQNAKSHGFHDIPSMSEEDIKALVGLGVLYDSGYESFRMGV